MPHFFAWRAVLMHYSGVLAIGVMSVAMGLPAGRFHQELFEMR